MVHIATLLVQPIPLANNVPNCSIETCHTGYRFLESNTVKTHEIPQVNSSTYSILQV